MKRLIIGLVLLVMILCFSGCALPSDYQSTTASPSNTDTSDSSKFVNEGSFNVNGATITVYTFVNKYGIVCSFIVTDNALNTVSSNISCH